MENQHRKIKGYRELDHVEIDMMNEIKAKAEEVGALIGKMRSLKQLPSDNDSVGNPQYDQRWISIGETHLQQGFMALTRSVAKPESF